jgi:hypothetical protein
MKRQIRDRPSLQAILGAFATVLLTLAASRAFAEPDDDISPDRPGIANGAWFFGKGRFQVEAGLQADFSHPGGVKDRTVTAPTLLRFGLNDRLEVRLEGDGYVWDRTTDPALGIVKSDGAAPLSLGMKYRIQNSDSTGRPALSILSHLTPASGSGAIRSHHVTGDALLVADWGFAPRLALTPNLGVGLYEDDNDRMVTAGLFAATVSYSASEKLTLSLDTGAQYPEVAHGKASVVVDAGLAYLVTHDLQLDISAGTGVAGRTSPRVFLAAGLSRRF